MPVLTVSGNEVTPATRILGIEGDRRTGESSFGCYPATRNLHPNPGFETNLNGWAAYGTGAAIARVTDDPAFGDACCQVTNGIESADFARVQWGRHGGVSPWVRAEPGATISVAVIFGGSTIASQTGVSVGADWQRIVVRYTPPGTTDGALTIRIERDGGGDFWLDGVMVQQNFNREDSDHPTTGSVITPYVHRDDEITVWPDQPNLMPNGDFETNVTGWSTFGAGASAPVQSATWAKTGTNSCKVTTDTSTGIGVRANNFASLAPNTLHIVSLWINGPATETYKVEVTDGGGRAGINFSFTPGKSVGRCILQFTTTATGGNATLYVAKNSANAIDFYLDDVRVKAQPASGEAPYAPDGVTSYASVTAPVAGVVRTEQMWFAIRTRLAFGSTEPPAGSVRMFRQRDDDAHRLEAFFAKSTDSWGVRRPVTGDTFFGAQISGTTFPVVTGDTYTFIGQYAPTFIAISLNGSAFDAYAQSKRASTEWPTITNPTFEIAATGASEGSQSGGQDVFWFAIGHGILDNADAAAIHALGDSDPAMRDFPVGSRPKLLWTAADATYQRRTVPTHYLGGSNVLGSSYQRFG